MLGGKPGPVNIDVTVAFGLVHGLGGPGLSRQVDNDVGRPRLLPVGWYGGVTDHDLSGKPGHSPLRVVVDLRVQHVQGGNLPSLVTELTRHVLADKTSTSGDKGLWHPSS